MKIKVIYHCYGGSHSSVTAAGIHLGLLPRERTAGAGELLKVPHFDTFEEIVHGHFRYIGRNSFNTAVYVLGKKTLGRKVTLLLKRLAEISGCGDRVVPVDTTGSINPLMVLGGFLSRRLRLVGIGRPLVILGTRIAYKRITGLVDEVKNILKERPACREVNPNSRRMVFYVCSGAFRLTLLVAGLHLNPDCGREELFKWAEDQKFTGEVGEIAGIAHKDGYNIYLVGAGNEPGIVARILKEYRGLLGIPESHWFVVETRGAFGRFFFQLGRVLRILRLKNISRLLERAAVQGLYDYCRKEAYRVNMYLQEGILD